MVLVDDGLDAAVHGDEMFVCPVEQVVRGDGRCQGQFAGWLYGWSLDDP